MGKELFGFYFITDRDLSARGVVDDVREALRAGSVLVQYRDKGEAAPAKDLASQILRECRKAGVALIINDDVDLAVRIKADGVHVGQTDTAVDEVRRRIGPHAIVGVSVSTVAEAQQAERAGATYLAASPVFATPTKRDAGPPIGVAGLCRLRAATRLPLAAIGGINEDNIAALVEAGADLICAISASLKGGAVYDNVRRLTSLMAPPAHSLGGQS